MSSAIAIEKSKGPTFDFGEQNRKGPSYPCIQCNATKPLACH